jgi:hypothetical protein
MLLQVIYFLAFSGLNVSLWAIPLEQGHLFLIASLLGVLYFFSLAWAYRPR